jgi:hypothetical protein
MKRIFIALFALLSGIPHSLCAQQLKLLTPSMKNADTPVVLEWQSVSSGVYSVECSTSLNNDWKVIAEEFPSQGTTTKWTDRGSPTIETFRLSSGDPLAPYRFYRVKLQRTMSAAGAIVVTTTTPAQNATVSGVIQVAGSASASQGIGAVRLYVDGHLAGRTKGAGYSFALDTRYYCNGVHRLSIVAEDRGGIESTEPSESDATASREACYGVRNVNVTFNNTLSNVRLRFEHFVPEAEMIERVLGTWSTRRNWQVDVVSRDGSTTFRTFTGSGQGIEIAWDGKDASEQFLNPQIINYNFYDLGPAAPLPPGGGPTPPSPPPLPQSALAQRAVQMSPSSEEEAVRSGASSYFVTFPTPEAIARRTAPIPPIEIPISQQRRSRVLAWLRGEKIPQSASTLANSGGQIALLQQAQMQVPQPYSIMGSMVVGGQGHHPLVGLYSTPPRLGAGSVRMSSEREFGPWGRLKRVKGLVQESSDAFERMGYAVIARKLDDQLFPWDLSQGASSPPNIFNQANIGLFIGHSVAAKDIEQGFSYRQSYIPIYNQGADDMSWVGTGEMSFGSPSLKWMAFFSCNLLRDAYRPNPVYNEMKSHFAVPMNSYLHILQAYATEMSVHPEFAFYWTLALRGSPLAGSSVNHSVIGAWNYACRQVQPRGRAGDSPNVARSVYWPECQGDFIYGYGPQTDPQRDPEDPLEQFDLLERDELATANEP